MCQHSALPFCMRSLVESHTWSPGSHTDVSLCHKSGKLLVISLRSCWAFFHTCSHIFNQLSAPGDTMRMEFCAYSAIQRMNPSLTDCRCRLCERKWFLWKNERVSGTFFIGVTIIIKYQAHHDAELFHETSPEPKGKLVHWALTMFSREKKEKKTCLNMHRIHTLEAFLIFHQFSKFLWSHVPWRTCSNAPVSPFLQG